MNGKLKRALCLLLSLILLWQVAPVSQVQAAEVRLPEVEIGEEILANDLFYLPTTAATLREGANETYTLRVGRGGEASTESSVLVRISDMTAQYGKDYTIAVTDGSSKVVVPEDNYSLMDLLVGQDFTVTELKDEEEAEAIFAEDEEGMEAAEAGVAEALNYIADRTGIGAGEETALSAVEKARGLYTGVEGGSQRVEANGDMYQQLQDVADVMTEVVPGAGVVLTFAPGETEKLLRITVNDNSEADGDRMFFLILSETDGSTTNSAASSGVFTIEDDEVQTPSVVSFSQESYSEIEDGMVTVTLVREGALNSVVSARVKTAGGSAMAGRDYSEVDRELVFPFGVSEMPLQIPVETAYLDGEGDFVLTLEAGTGCTVSEQTATVRLTGAGAAQAAESAETRASRGIEQTLTLVRTAEAINLANYWRRFTAGYGMNKIATNAYDPGTNRWQMQWDETWDYHGGRGPTIATWALDSEDAWWYAGARMTLETTEIHSNHHSVIRVAFDGRLSNKHIYNGDTYVNAVTTNGRVCYDSAQYFTGPSENQKSVTVDFYTTRFLVESGSSLTGYHPDAAVSFLTIVNDPGCSDCNWLYISDVQPILRPFQATLIESTPVLFLQEDGSYASDPSDDALRATISGSRDEVHQVVFLGDAVTVTQPSGTNVQRYLTLSGIEYVPANNRVASKLVASSQNLSNASVTLDMTKENIGKMFSMAGSRFAENKDLMNQYKNGANARFYLPQFSTQVATYGDMLIRPKFDYINAKVKLENPYDFSVCYSISGTDYWVLPKQTVELQNIHLGDTLAVTGLRVGAGNETNYVPVGVDMSYCYKANSGDFIHDTKRFSSDTAIYLGGEDNRLCYEEVVLSPNLTEMKTQIQVKVKTSELSKFQSAGLLSMPSTVDGDYTYFTCVAPGQMMSGKIYPITAVPKSTDTVCIWTINNGNRYIGNCFLFEAGKAESQEDNLITLTTAPAKSDMKLSGTLTYRDYNLRTRDAGSASTKPAAGAIVVAGNITARADDKGVLNSTSMKVPATPYRYKLRCMVVINGFQVIRDLSLPMRGNEVSISSTFDTGVSPIGSPIFKNVKVTTDAANTEGLIPVGDFTESFTVNVSVKPIKYNVQRADGNGSYVTASRFEKPVSVQIKIVDATGQLRYVFDPLTEAAINNSTGEYIYKQEIPFQISVPTESNPEEYDVIYEAQPGDQILLTLNTDLTEQGSDLQLDDAALNSIGTSEMQLSQDGQAGNAANQYCYSEVNTGLALYSLNEYTPPVEQGLGDTPFEFKFTELPFLGDIGMNLNFPFANVGWQKTAFGYRMYIGFSPIDVIDKVMGTHINAFATDDGIYSSDGEDAESTDGFFKKTFNKIGDRFKSVFGGRNGQTKQDVAELGAPQWRFSFSVGMAFDFFVGTVTDEYGISTTEFILSGVGVYASATVGFKTSWYTIVPVVFIPAYFGLSFEATVMGVFQGHRADNNPKIVTMHDAQTVPRIDLAGSCFDTLLYNINAAGMVQISFGVGLCGTIGARFVGEFYATFNYDQPQTVEGVRDWGVLLKFRAGGIIDLFIASVPLMYTFPLLKYGSYADMAAMKGTANEIQYSYPEGEDPFTYRTGYNETSEWLGNKTVTRGAFTPKQTYTLVENSYERADPQLITLRNGTVVLAYLTNDPDKGPYQRTTLMLTTYKNGVWTEPVVVSDDGTADFQPSIAETQDGRVLLSWVSNEAADITEDTPTVDYLRSMEVYAAFAEVAENGAITVGETQRISHDRRAEAGEDEHYYDANPTVVCDTKSGDAIIYYIKSGSVSDDATELANPYVNDSTICYMPYDSAKGKWMTDEFYEGEIGDPASEQYLIDNFCGQRFLDAPTFTTPDGGREYYAIPDFTAIASDGLAIYAYTVDRDSSNDSDTDKEVFLQVYSFENHYTYWTIRLTEDVVADALPQLIRTEREEDGDTVENVKLFWYRGGLGVSWIDVTDLLKDGINPDGTFKEKEDGSEPGIVPHAVDRAHTEANEANQMADFYVTQDENGSLYVVWTDSVTDEETNKQSRELFAVCQYVEPDPETEGNGDWSKPYQLTHSGLQNDELALTLDGSNLLVVHNQYDYELTDDETNPLILSDLKLAATTLEPCGSVATERVDLLPIAAEGEAQSTDPIKLVQPGQTVLAQITVSNDGLTTAEGYHLDVYQVSADGEKKLQSIDDTARLTPNTWTTSTFEWTVPENVEGTYLRVEAVENNYTDVDVFTSDPLEVRAEYAITNLNPYQAADGFHLAGTLTNVGNAATGDGECFGFYLTGPYGLTGNYSKDERMLCSVPIESIAAGESADIDVLVDVPADMMAEWHYVAGMAGVYKQVENEDLTGENATDFEWLGETSHVDFVMSAPMGFTLNEGKPYELAVGETAALNATLELGELMGGDEIAYSVADPSIAQIADGKLLGMAAGETDVFAIHVPTGTTVSVPVTVTGKQENPFRFDDVQDENAFYFDPVYWAYNHDPQITTGTSETTFSPNGAATRAQVVTFLWRAAGNPEPKGTSNPFTDVADDTYYTKAVLWAVEEGITKGTSETRFSPDRTCSRGELVTFLYRFAKTPTVGEIDNPFTDVNADTYYYDAVLWAAEQKVTTGTSATTFAPNKICTRGEIVTFLYRYMGEE